MLLAKLSSPCYMLFARFVKILIAFLFFYSKPLMPRLWYVICANCSWGPVRKDLGRPPPPVHAMGTYWCLETIMVSTYRRAASCLTLVTVRTVKLMKTSWHMFKLVQIPALIEINQLFMSLKCADQGAECSPCVMQVTHSIRELPATICLTILTLALHSDSVGLTIEYSVRQFPSVP